jgi:DNA processing protein
MTGYGEQITKQIVRSLKHHNVIIVSGMARGIDMTAHLAALESGLKTIAVLGSGLKKIPFYNYSIANVIANSGAVITEYPPFTIGQKYNFPLRNRIISGLSKVTVIVEAGEKSGALITAQYALDQSREVLAVPGNIANEKSKGTNRIIKNSGAALLKEPEDILEVLGISQKTAKISKFLTLDQKKIIEALNKNSLSHSSLIKETQFAANKLNSTLTELEIDGLIDRNKDGKYFLKH